MKLPEPTSDALNEELPDSAIASAARALPAGARLDEFDVEEIIGEGSVEIVYGATDRALAVPLAIAEYIPARLAQRNEDAQVRPRTSGLADAFATGLKAFIDETRMAELDQEFSLAAGREVIVTFTPHLVPMNRGILSTIYVRGRRGRTPEDLHDRRTI